MTPMEVVTAFCEFARDTLANFRFADETGVEVPVTVYPFHLPEQLLSAMNAHDEDGNPITIDDNASEKFTESMPAVIVRPLSFEGATSAYDVNAASLTLSVTVGVYSQDSENIAGSQGVVNILEHLRQALEMQPIIGKRCEVILPVSWELFDEAMRPLWFGELTVQCRILTPMRVSDKDTDWQGDFASFEKGSASSGNKGKNCD